jgi:hypothetical protein
LYASRGDDPDDSPFILDANMRNIRQAHMELYFAKYPLVETVRPPGRQAAWG